MVPTDRINFCHLARLLPTLVTQLQEDPWSEVKYSEWGTLVGTSVCDVQETTVADLTQKSATTVSWRKLDQESDCF